MAIPGICILLAAMVWAVFGQTLRHEFVNYDDNQYVFQNPEVIQGLTLRGIAWAFTYAQIGHWHPVTWLSHMLDCNLYGLNPWGHHLTSVLLHGIAAILLFLVLNEMTGALWRSAFVAAVFAIHPLRVESVAWIAERKDVLSGVFFMLTLWAYVRYVRGVHTLICYTLMVILFALGLMSKGMLVTLPFVLLLLDYWPLGRLKVDAPDGRRIPLRELWLPLLCLIREKIPLFVLSAISCIMTNLSPEEATKLAHYSPIGNAVMSCVTYMRQMIYPVDLAIPYPYPSNGWPVAEVVLAAAFLAAISILSVVFWRTRPYFIVGWLWYLGMLVPVLGFVQISYYSHADRYTYLPQIGLYLLLTWAVADLSAGLPFRREALGGLGTIAITALMLCAHKQASYWQDSQTLWTHTLDCGQDSYYAHDNLGATLLEKGRVDEALYHFQRAMEINPNTAEIQFNFANALLQNGEVGQAISHYRKALEISPGYAEAHYAIALALVKAGETDEAIAHFNTALDTNPDDAEIHNNLAAALLKAGRRGEAIAHYKKALEIQPNYMEAQNNLARLLATSPQQSLRDGPLALELAQKANVTTGGNNPVVLGTLAAAYAETGQFTEAADAAKRALALTDSQENAAFAAALREQLALYEAGKPFRQPEAQNGANGKQ